MKPSGTRWVQGKAGGVFVDKKVVIISASLRKNSNSGQLAKAFASGAEKAGNTAEIISLAGKKLGFCTGCLSCQKTFHCYMHDDAGVIAEKIRDADVVVFATPVYYYGISGQLKTLLDRCNPIFPQEYRFRDVYILMAAADDNLHTTDKSIISLTGWTDCFPRCRLAGTVFAGGVTKPGDIEGHKALKEAFDAGMHV